MKRKISILCMMFMLTSLFYACSENSDEMIQDQNLINGDEVLLVPTTATLVNEKSVVQSEDSEVVEAEEFAKLLALAINGKDVRKFIKDEANKKFDGDFDILVSIVMDSKIGKLNFKDRIAQSSSFGASKGKEVFEKAIKNPKLNISVPIQIEKWNETKQQLLVAVGVGTIEGETEFVKAFDSKGRVYLIDFNIEPNVPVIVVGNNERMDYQKDADNEKSARKSGNFETISYIKCPNLSAIEAWIRGCPELRFDAVVYLDGQAMAVKAGTVNIEPSTRDQASNGYTLARHIFQWYFADNHGPDYYIQSAEIDDNGTTHKITVGVSAGSEGGPNASYELTYKNGDEILAGQLIHYSSSSPNSIADDLIEYKISNYYN